jgi:hypothetical protein
MFSGAKASPAGQKQTQSGAALSPPPTKGHVAVAAPGK